MAARASVCVFLAGIAASPVIGGRAMAQAANATPKPSATVAPAPDGEHVPPIPAGVTGPVARLPGFEMQADGGSRVFVELTQSVPVEERRAGHRITYVLKGAKVALRNNKNPLVTVHFNTPVTSARLRPAGSDLDLIVDLRADVTPTWKLSQAKDNTAILQIDFPKGDFLGRPVPPSDDSGRPRHRRKTRASQPPPGQ